MEYDRERPSDLHRLIRGRAKCTEALIREPNGGAEHARDSAMTDEKAARVAAHLAACFREQSGRILAGLIHALSDFDLVDEALQEACSEALLKWPASGVPANAGAWLTTVARGKALEVIRRRHFRPTEALGAPSIPDPIAVIQRKLESSIEDGSIPLRGSMLVPESNGTRPLSLQESVDTVVKRDLDPC
ncbi:MAG: hypothetical protein ACI841_002726 [Planctomycetota bacterium]|jgi:hypothetical protein